MFHVPTMRTEDVGSNEDYIESEHKQIMLTY
jgi:hypothetical protein